MMGKESPKGSAIREQSKNCYCCYPLLTPQKKSRKEKEKIEKENTKIQKDTYEESLEDCPSW
jgi:hypothetical protein